MLFIHVILGVLYHVWRRDWPKAALTLISNIGLVFNDLNSSKADVISIGEGALVALYKGRPGNTLDHLRLQKCHHKIIVSK